MKTEEILQEMQILQRKLLQNIVGDYNTDMQKIDENYNMGLIDFTQRLRQIEDITINTKFKIKANKLENLIT